MPTSPRNPFEPGHVVSPGDWSPQSGTSPLISDLARLATGPVPAPLPREQVGPSQSSWLDEVAQQERQRADAMGITDIVFQLLAAGRTTTEVTAQLSHAGVLDPVPVEDRHTLVLMTCATLGIPLRDAPEGEAAFATWQQARAGETCADYPVLLSTYRDAAND